MFNEDGEYIGGRYTVIYDGYLFVGDKKGLNFHDYDSWDEVKSLIDAYGMEPDLKMEVHDNMYSVIWYKGEWY